MKIIFRLIVMSLLIFAAGCATQGSPAQKPQQQTNQSAQQIPINNELAETVKQTAKTVKGVEDSTAVVINKDISTAIRVSGFDRLRLKSIKEEVHTKIKDLNQDYTVHVTSDKKLFVHLQQIEKEIKGEQKKPLQEIQQRVEKINKDMQG